MMKQIIRFLLALPCLCTFLTFQSCEIVTEGGYRTEAEATYELCRYYWYADYRDYNGNGIRQAIYFWADGSGRRDVYYNQPGMPQVERTEFYGYWGSRTYRAVIMEFATGETTYWDDIFISGNILTCFTGEKYLTFYGG